MIFFLSAKPAASIPQYDSLKGIRIFDLSALPYEKDLSAYGESEIENYSFLVNKCECKLEWDAYKQAMSANFSKFKIRDLKFLLKLDRLIEVHKTQYPNKMVLIFRSISSVVR